MKDDTKLFCPVCLGRVMEHLGLENYVWCPLKSELYNIDGCGWRGKENELLTENQRDRKLKLIFLQKNR